MAFGIDDIAGGVIGGGLGLIGSLLGKGSKVKIPAFQPVDANKVQQDSIEGNIASFDRARTLTSKVNESSFEDLHNYLSRAVPGYDKIVSKQSEVIQKQLNGEIPDDVANAIAQKGAARATAGGFGGSGMARNLVARDLGLTSYDITNQALAKASSFVTSLRSVAVPELMSPSSMFLSPSQRLNAAIGQNTEGYNAQVMAAQANAMPDPTLSSLGSFMGGFGGLMFRSAAPSIFGSGSGYGGGSSSYGASSYSLLSGSGSMGMNSYADGWGNSNPYRY